MLILSTRARLNVRGGITWSSSFGLPPCKKISTPAAFPLRLCRFRTLVFVSSCFIFLALLFSFAQPSCMSLMSASRDVCVCLKEVGVLAGQKSMLCEATCQLGAFLHLDSPCLEYKHHVIIHQCYLTCSLLTNRFFFSVGCCSHCSLPPKGRIT